MIATTDKSDFWRHHQLNWQRSGLNQKAYCQQHHLSYSAFKYWRVHQKVGNNENTPPSVVPVHITQPTRLFQCTDVIEIHVGLTRVTLPLSMPPQYVSDLVKALA